MDIPLRRAKRASAIRLSLTVLVGLTVLTMIIVGACRLKPAAPVVDRSTIWTDVVRRGSIVRQVRGSGNLVPKMIRWITAPTEGRVDNILVQAGMAVGNDTVLLELSNREVEKSVLDAQWQLTSAEAELTTREAQLKDELLSMRADLAKLKAEYEQAKIQSDVDEKLFQEGLLAERNWQLSSARVSQLAELTDISTKQSESKSVSQPAELAVYQARVAQAKTLCEFRRKSLESLRVCSGTEGVLQEWEDGVQIGKQVAVGMPLARVCDPEQLKAVIRIPEAQAHDVQVGQHAQVDVGNAVMEGRVARLDPGAQGGTVSVDVSLDEPLAKGARPDQSVVGTIDIERLDNVLYVRRPANSYPGATVRLFRIEKDVARAVSVTLGSASVSTIQVLEGLQEGDTVILSETSQQDGVDCVRLR